MKILLPTDFSDNARHAQEYAFALFGDSADYVLLNAVDKGHTSSGMLINIEEIMQKDSHEGLDREMAHLREKGIAGNLNITTASHFGTPGSVAARLADRGDIDMIVMGTQGASGIKELLVGSNTADLIQQVSCPVLAVPAHTPIKPPAKIVFAHDKEGCKSEAAVEPLIALSNRTGAQILALTVTESGESEPDMSGMDKMLAGTATSFHTINDDDVAEGIDGFVQEKEADMVAMIPRHTSFFKRIFHTSVTRQVAMHTRVPMLAIYDR